VCFLQVLSYHLRASGSKHLVTSRLVYNIRIEEWRASSLIFPCVRKKTTGVELFHWIAEVKKKKIDNIKLIYTITR